MTSYPALYILTLPLIWIHPNKALSIERRVAERTAELKQTNMEFEYASRAKDEFLANMSHELLMSGARGEKWFHKAELQFYF